MTMLLALFEDYLDDFGPTPQYHTHPMRILDHD